MIALTLWPVVNVIASFIVALIIAYKLVCLHDRFTHMERAGMGLIGAGALLTIGPLTSTYPTPYEDWSATLLRVGCMIYFIGRILRHKHNNAAAVRQARRHAARKAS
jgi:hypothetical protein